MEAEKGGGKRRRRRMGEGGRVSPQQERERRRTALPIFLLAFLLSPPAAAGKLEHFCIRENMHISYPYRLYNGVNYRPCQCGKSYYNHPDLTACRPHCVAPDSAPLPGFEDGEMRAVDTGVRPGGCKVCYGGSHLSWTEWSECREHCAKVKCLDDCSHPRGTQYATLQECDPGECQALPGARSLRPAAVGGGGGGKGSSSSSSTPCARTCFRHRFRVVNGKCASRVDMRPCQCGSDAARGKERFRAGSHVESHPAVGNKPDGAAPSPTPPDTVAIGNSKENDRRPSEAVEVAGHPLGIAAGEGGGAGGKNAFGANVVQNAGAPDDKALDEDESEGGLVHQIPDIVPIGNFEKEEGGAKQRDMNKILSASSAGTTMGRRTSEHLPTTSVPAIPSTAVLEEEEEAGIPWLIQGGGGGAEFRPAQNRKNSEKGDYQDTAEERDGSSSRQEEKEEEGEDDKKRGRHESHEGEDCAAPFETAKGKRKCYFEVCKEGDGCSVVEAMRRCSKEKGRLAEPEWKKRGEGEEVGGGREAEHILEHFCSGPILTWLGAYRDEALSDVYWKYRASKKIFHYEDIGPSRSGGGFGESEEYLMAHRRKRRSVSAMAVGGRYTGLDHDHVLFCGGAGRRRKRGGDSSSASEEEDKGRHEERGFGSESDPDARGKGLCEREASAAVVVESGGGNKAFGKEGGGKEGAPPPKDKRLRSKFKMVQIDNRGSKGRGGGGGAKAGKLVSPSPSTPPPAAKDKLTFLA